MTEITIVWNKLEDLFTSMNEVGAQSDEVATYFRDQVCSKDGFIGVLSPLADAMPKISGYFDDMDNVFDKRWAGVADAIGQSARGLDRTDESISIDMDRLRGLGPSGGGNNAPLSVDLPRLIKPADVAGKLTEPERGDNSLKHDKKFDWVADAWDTGVDIIQQGITFLRRLGFDLEDVPIQSLRDYVVYPLSGDWGAIRANGNACGICRDAMTTWGNNFSLLSGNVTGVMLGQTSVRLVAHMNLYNLAARGMGAGISKGEAVFDSIAEVSERIGREVEDALVWLGQKIGKLLAKIGTRCIPYLGWAILAIEVLFKGKEAFTDIWDDAVACFEMVNDLLDLVDETKAWAQTQAERLDTFKTILEAANDLPVVGGHQGVDDLAASVGDIESSLSKVAEFELGGSTEQEDVDKRLDGMDERAYEPPADDSYHKEPMPLDPDDRDEPLPGPDQRLSYGPGEFPDE